MVLVLVLEWQWLLWMVLIGVLEVRTIIAQTQPLTERSELFYPAAMSHSGSGYCSAVLLSTFWTLQQCQCDRSEIGVNLSE